MAGTPEEEPEVGRAAEALSLRARALFIAAVMVFLVLPVVAMLIMLTSGGGLSDLFDSILSEFGKQLSSVAIGS